MTMALVRAVSLLVLNAAFLAIHAQLVLLAGSCQDHLVMEHVLLLAIPAILQQPVVYLVFPERTLLETNVYLANLDNGMTTAPVRTVLLVAWAARLQPIVPPAWLENI